ncbi:MAG: alpha/beta hydrolase [Alphaproteobacteria bacterium]|nr:MAG: alpha/beta hydrolase [Alphaproteobacteria bacterium]
MATRGLFGSLLVGIWITCSLVDCSSLPRVPFTRAQQDVARIPGISDARIWADDPTALARTAPFSEGQHKPTSIDVLALSGGGAEGAFGAGLLVGWTEAGNRPEFSIISGTSSGALIAPFAFLGASHDPTLRELFTSGIAERLLRVDGLNAIFGSGVFKTEPLKLLVAHYIDENLLNLVAAQHRRGRRLFIVTTNIDAQRTAVWNMGAIAASDYSGRLQLFRDVLVASASAPGLFAPAYIEVQAGNTLFQEMHVDGAVTSNVLAVPESVLMQKVAFSDTAKPKLYIIVNGKITPDFAVIGDGTLSIVARSFYSTVKANTRNTLIATYDFARRNGWQFRLAAIQPDYPMTSTTFNFDTDYMRGLFNLGFSMGRTGQQWQSSLKALSASPGTRRF